MSIRLLAAGLVAATLAAAPVAAQSSAADARFRAAQDRFDREYQIYRQEVDRYQAARASYRDVPPPPGYDGGYRTAPDAYAPGYGDDRYENGYDPSRYYRSGNYSTRTLGVDDRVYAGTDGRYYCRRSDGTTGLILGAVGGGILGNIIDGGHSRGVGTLLGAGGGALAGRAIEQNQSVQCR